MSFFRDLDESSKHLLLRSLQIPHNIRSFYKIIACKDNSSFPWKSIWWTQTPLKVAFFTWSAALRKILTMDNLRKRHFILVNRYCLCKLNGESVDLLLLHCEVANALWNAIFSHFRLSWVMPNCVVDLFACQWLGGNSWSVAIHKMMSLASCGACGGKEMIGISKTKRGGL
jgi:hypothetical protein